MNTFDMASMLREAGDRMRLSLRSRLVPHPGERGMSRETILRTFLADHLPRKFVVDTGFVFDCTGRCSEQMDIIIADANNCPLFQDAGGRHFFPAEGVVAVGQVRSSATSQNTWHSALDNLESTKHLDRSGKGQSINKLTGEALEPRDNHLHQMSSFFFVVGVRLNPKRRGICS
jgi:hypothetical protein